jgi:hypothetical protein
MVLTPVLESNAMDLLKRRLKAELNILEIPKLG